MGRINVLIGANGAGKSNLIAFFRLIARIIERQLQVTVSAAGGPDALLQFGRKHTEQIVAELYFGNHGYKICLQLTEDNRLMFAREALYWDYTGRDFRPASGHFESALDEHKGD